MLDDQSHAFGKGEIPYDATEKKRESIYQAFVLLHN